MREHALAETMAVIEEARGVTAPAAASGPNPMRGLTDQERDKRRSRNKRAKAARRRSR